MEKKTSTCNHSGKNIPFALCPVCIIEDITNSKITIKVSTTNNEPKNESNPVRD